MGSCLPPQTHTNPIYFSFGFPRIKQFCFWSCQNQACSTWWLCWWYVCGCGLKAFTAFTFLFTSNEQNRCLSWDVFFRQSIITLFSPSIYSYTHRIPWKQHHLRKTNLQLKSNGYYYDAVTAIRCYKMPIAITSSSTKSPGPTCHASSRPLGDSVNSHVNLPGRHFRQMVGWSAAGAKSRSPWFTLRLIWRMCITSRWWKPDMKTMVIGCYRMLEDVIGLSSPTWYGIYLDVQR